MRIISLNTFFGTIFESLVDWIEQESKTTDVFCFQEMMTNPAQDLPLTPYNARPGLLQELKKRLPDFEILFANMQDDFDITPAYPKQMQMGNAIFYRKTIPVTDSGSFFIYHEENNLKGKEWETLGHNAVWIGFENITVVGLHGNSEPAHKRDTPRRLEQSQKVLDFLAGRSGEKIIMGDFNLFPDTQSVAMFEQAGFRNLVMDNGITTTRGAFMRELYPQYAHGPYGYQDFADYTFVSPGVHVSNFVVPETRISDHLPMILDIA